MRRDGRLVYSPSEGDAKIGLVSTCWNRDPDNEDIRISEFNGSNASDPHPRSDADPDARVEI